jgi:hypothetical protein
LAEVTDHVCLSEALLGVLRKMLPPTNERVAHSLGLLMKVHLHATSAFYLSRGIPGSSSQRPVQFDVASVFVLCRAAFEAFLTFHHVFAEPESQDDRDCRHLGWRLASLLRRQVYHVKQPESLAKLDQERKDIAQIETRLASNPAYLALKTGARDRLRRDGRTEGWRAIAQSAGLSDVNAKDWYDFVCGHAHSGASSIWQILQAGEVDAHQLMKTGIGVNLSVMALMLDAFVRVFPESSPFLTKEQLTAVHTWKYIGSKH